MPTVNLRDARASFSSLVDEAVRGEFVTITRHGKPAAVLVSVEAADIARKALEQKRPGLAAYLRAFPGGEMVARLRSLPGAGEVQERDEDVAPDRPGL